MAVQARQGALHIASLLPLVNSVDLRDCCAGYIMGALGIEPRVLRMRSGCDTTTPRALAIHTDQAKIMLSGICIFIIEMAKGTNWPLDNMPAASVV